MDDDVLVPIHLSCRLKVLVEGAHTDDLVDVRGCDPRDQLPLSGHPHAVQRDV